MAQNAVLTAPTVIEKGDTLVTEITFLHCGEQDVAHVCERAVRMARAQSAAPGCVATNVLVSRDETRVCIYSQWVDRAAQAAGLQSIAADIADLTRSGLLENPVAPRTYSIVYADDRSKFGKSIISPAYRGAIFINEITTQPATQQRLLDLVIANNQIQSINTPGYRSANFHKSHDGEHAVNYSLWDSEDQCIDAISRMADMDENLDETVRIASPDFRFYTLAFSTHV
jgi:heme-degrading monooxygenase HmoA